MAFQATLGILSSVAPFIILALPGLPPLFPPPSPPRGLCDLTEKCYPTSRLCPHPLLLPSLSPQLSCCRPTGPLLHPPGLAPKYSRRLGGNPTGLSCSWIS